MSNDEPTGLLPALLAVQAEAPTLPKNATNPQEECPDCGGWKHRRSERCRSCSHKARTGEVRTDAPAKSTTHYRARRTQPVVQCQYEDCEAPGVDRHHVDANPFNNDPSNLAAYCRRHHMLVDGRLAATAERAPRVGKLGGRPKEPHVV